MTKKHYITIAICSMLIIICTMLYISYYKEYIAPESYVIGGISTPIPYKELSIASYISDDEVIFSQNINNQSFVKDENEFVYEYNFDAKEFDGIAKDYLIFVNNYMLNDLTSNAGTISGVYILNYYDVNKAELCSSQISIDFSFYSLSSSLKVRVNSNELGYLMNYFKTNDFIITLTENPFKFDKNTKIEGETQYFKITYMVNGEIYGTQLYEQFTEVSLLNCTEEGFVCWMSGDTYIQDNFVITKDEILVAYIEDKTVEENTLTATFKVGDTTYKQLTTTNGYITETVDNPTVSGYEFEYWTINGTNAVDNISSYKLTEDTTFIALFGYWENIEGFVGQFFGITDYNQSAGYLFTTTLNEAKEFTEMFTEIYNYTTSQLLSSKHRFTIGYAWFDEGLNYYSTTNIYTNLNEAQTSLERGEMALAVVNDVIYVTFKYKPPQYIDGTDYEGYLTQSRETIATIEKLEKYNRTTNVSL